jgi:hypothetical protein
MWGVVVAAALVAGVGPAGAQAPSGAGEAEAASAAENLNDLIASLDSGQWAVRQHAEDSLREALSDLATLEEALSGIDQELSAEARRRLIKLGEEVFQRSPRPGVGIQFSRTAEGVRIDATVRGFDADAHLKRGDVVLSFGGVATPDEDTMRTAIMVHDPEDVVPVDVRRDNEIISLQLRLGWYRDLQNPRPPDAAAMRRAWAVRAARHLSGVEDPVVQMNLDASLWRDCETETRQAQAQLQQQRRPVATLTPKVSFAGSSVEQDHLVLAARRADDAALMDQRQAWLDQLDARVENLSERITALEVARRRLNGENAEMVEQLERELERLRTQRQELLNIRRTNTPP